MSNTDGTGARDLYKYDGSTGDRAGENNGACSANLSAAQWHPDKTLSTAKAQEWDRASKASLSHPLELNPNGTYTVRDGDSLSTIAERALGGPSAANPDAIKAEVRQMVAMNQDKYPSLCSNPDLIQDGWHLKIPRDAQTAVAAGSQYGDIPPQVAPSVGQPGGYPMDLNAPYDGTPPISGAAAALGAALSFIPNMIFGSQQNYDPYWNNNGYGYNYGYDPGYGYDTGYGVAPYPYVGYSSGGWNRPHPFQHGQNQQQQLLQQELQQQRQLQAQQQQQQLQQQQLLQQRQQQEQQQLAQQRLQQQQQRQQQEQQLLAQQRLQQQEQQMANQRQQQQQQLAQQRQQQEQLAHQRQQQQLAEQQRAQQQQQQQQQHGFRHIA